MNAVHEKAAMDSAPVNAGIILCAGLSSRMKDFKPLLPLDGRTLIECTIGSLLQAGIDHIVLVVGHRGKDIEEVLLKRNYPFVTAVHNPRYADSDMMESVRIGIRTATLRWPLESVFVLPGDMPKINPRTMSALLQQMHRYPCKVCIPRYKGENAHPPLIHASCLNYLTTFEGQGGLKAALNAFSEGTVYMPVDDQGCTMDADTSDDYQRLVRYSIEAASEAAGDTCHLPLDTAHFQSKRGDISLSR